MISERVQRCFLKWKKTSWLSQRMILLYEMSCIQHAWFLIHHWQRQLNLNIHLSRFIRLNEGYCMKINIYLLIRGCTPAQELIRNPQMFFTTFYCFFPTCHSSQCYKYTKKVILRKGWYSLKHFYDLSQLIHCYKQLKRSESFKNSVWDQAVKKKKKTIRHHATPSWKSNKIGNKTSFKCVW